MSVSFCLPHPVAVSAFMICRGLCACTEMLWMCVLYVSLGSKVRPRTFGCVAMGSALLFIVRSRLLVYSAGSGVNRVQVVLSGFPAETNKPLPAQFDIIFNECQINGHKLSECSPSHNISTCGANQLINSILRDSFYFPEEKCNVSQCIPNSSYPWLHFNSQ